ncbi:MAG TPA: oxygenase MpaB family protein [Polyangiaceae bacterium]|nr:oxygenase MpaB family protein [Polyangiaceae bacterium]
MLRAVSKPDTSLSEPVRAKLVAHLNAALGPQNEEEFYGGEPGDPGLIGPGSMSWEINGDLASLLLAGTGAILMELLHPSVMAGVYTFSNYQRDQLRRTQNTLGYVLRTTFGNTAAATRLIDQVKGIHGRIQGVRPDGVPYRALDPELIGWVHTCIPWAVMTAYDRYRRPLSLEEKNRYLREQAVIGRMGGADRVPETVGELEEYVERMRPKLAVNEQTLNFIDFVRGRTEDIRVSEPERWYRWLVIHTSMSLMPEWAQRLTHTAQPKSVRGVLAPTDRLRARLLHWVVPEMPCKRMALARVSKRVSQDAPSQGPSRSFQVSGSA